jgi:ParB family chromosome partitioning protein
MGQAPDVATLTGMGERVVVRQIPTAEIGANPDQPRKTFTKAELQELADSIKEHGVLQPIIVREAEPGAGAAKPYEIVAGERRWRASIIAGKETIPALVKTMTPENAMELALIENVQRENLNAIEEGEAYKNIMEKCGYSMTDLGRLIGKSDSYIRNSLRICGLPENVKELVKSGKLSASHARTIAVAENPEKLAERIISENMSVAEAGDFVKMAGERKGTARRGRLKENSYNPDFVRATRERIRRALDLDVKLKVNNTGSGSITIGFVNMVQLQLLTHVLTYRTEMANRGSQ